MNHFNQCSINSGSSTEREKKSFHTSLRSQILDSGISFHTTLISLSLFSFGVLFFCFLLVSWIKMPKFLSPITVRKIWEMLSCLVSTCTLVHTKQRSSVMIARYHYHVTDSSVWITVQPLPQQQSCLIKYHNTKNLRNQMTAQVILFMYSYFNKLLLYLEKILLNILDSMIHEFFSCPKYGQAKESSPTQTAIYWILLRFLWLRKTRSLETIFLVISVLLTKKKIGWIL